MKKGEINLYTFAILALILIFIGCISLLISRRDDGILNDRELIEKVIKGWGLNDFNDVEDNAREAISQYENNTIDQVPVLVGARLRDVYEDEIATLDLIAYDENGDLLGFVINEKHIDPNGVETNLEEEYPVFLFFSLPKGENLPVISVKIRKSGELKSEEAWENYIAGNGIEIDQMKQKQYWYSTLPEKWMSIPEPNKTEVEMYLYDKAGNKSKPVKVRHIEVQ